MTRVQFIVNLQDLHAKAVTLCERYLNKGHQLTIVGASVEVNTLLSQQLWQSAAVSFLPHAYINEANAAYAPIHLQLLHDKPMQDDVLINLQPEVPIFFGRFRQLIELVGDTETDKVAARERWKFYRDRGYAMQSIDDKTD